MRRLFVLVFLSLLLASAAAATETTSAVVTGAELLYVRRGPGVTFPAFATIERGERLEVERLDGVWALVRLASGQTGYVHSTFLSFPGETRSTIIIPATATPTQRPDPSATIEDKQAVVVAEPKSTPMRESETRTVPTATADHAQAEATAPHDAIAEAATLQSDVQRLTIAVDTLQKRMSEAPYPAGSPDGSSPPDHSWHSATVGALLVLALLIGWMGGSAYGRQTERSRRGRIRF